MMFGLNSEDVSALGAVAQAVLALAAFVASVAMSSFVWYGTRRIAQLDYERSLRDAWVAVDTVALSNDDMLKLADTLMDPKNANDAIETRRKRWFAYMVLNGIVSAYFGAKYESKSSRNAMIEGCRELLRPLMLHDEIFEIIQRHGYEPEVRALCRDVREEQLKLGTAEQALN